MGLGANLIEEDVWSILEDSKGNIKKVFLKDTERLNCPDGQIGTIATGRSPAGGGSTAPSSDPPHCAHACDGHPSAWMPACDSHPSCRTKQNTAANIMCILVSYVL